MAVNLKTCEFALPNTIRGTVPSVSGTSLSSWEGSQHADTSEEWIIMRCPPGKLLQINNLWVVKGDTVSGSQGPKVFCAMFSSVNGLDWSNSIGEHSYYAHWTGSETHYRGLSGDLYHSNNAGKGQDITYGSNKFDNRMPMWIAYGARGSSGGDSDQNRTHVVDTSTGPIYLTGGDALYLGTNSDAIDSQTNTNYNSYWDRQGDFYTMSYIEYY